MADEELTNEVCDQVARSIAALIINKKKGRRIAIGRDCRPSSDRIKAALTTGFLASEIDIVDVGLVPTPLLYFAVNGLKLDGGIMITGSHNPPEYNGLKICIGPSTIHGEEIQEIRKVALRGDFPQGKGVETSNPIIEDYLKFVTANIKLHGPIKVVVDSGNGMGGIVGPELYRRLGCEVIELFSEPDGRFPNHHPDPTVVENLKFLLDEVKTSKAVVGIGFDGDANRIGVVDASGRILFGDELLVLFSRQVLSEHKGATVISEVKASHRLYLDIASHGGVPVMWKTGHSLIKAKMKETGALLAGEMSGHIFFKDRYYGFDDAIYAGARLLEILTRYQKTSAQLLSDLPASFSTPEIRVDCPDEIKFRVVEESKAKFISLGLKVNTIDGARIDFGDGWGLVRASNTQPVLVFRFEASSESET